MLHVFNTFGIAPTTSSATTEAAELGKEILVGSQRNTATRNATREYLVAAAIGVAGSVIIVPLIYLQVGLSLLHFYLVAAVLGFWVLPFALASLLVRRPGATLVAALTIGFISALTSPFGASALGALALEGVLFELPFVVLLYRRWSAWQYVISVILLCSFLGWFVPQAVGSSDQSVLASAICASIATAMGLVLLLVTYRLHTKVLAAGVLRKR